MTDFSNFYEVELKLEFTLGEKDFEGA